MSDADWPAVAEVLLAELGVLVAALWLASSRPWRADPLRRASMVGACGTGGHAAGR